MGEMHAYLTYGFFLFFFDLGGAEDRLKYGENVGVWDTIQTKAFGVEFFPAR